ncbi:MAG: hypothetical protein V4444_04585 [Pseudomonadota bacterium]
MKRIRGTPPVHSSQRGPIDGWERTVARDLKRWNLEEQEIEFRRLIIEAIIDYWFTKDSDETSVTPGQVADYAESVERAAANLKSLISPDALDSTRHLILGEMDPAPSSDLEKAINAFVEATKAVEAEVGKPSEGSGPRLEPIRQTALAQWFIKEFEAREWPTATGDNSALAYAVGIVLRTAGETPKKVGAILRAAKQLST